MIKFSNINDMSVVKQGDATKKVLFKIFGEKQKQNNNQRLPLNLSLVIDVSGSMNDQVGNKVQVDNDAARFLGNLAIKSGYLNSRGFNSGKTKLSQVKEAATNCIDLLQNGDYISVITFNTHANIVQESIKIDSQNKQAIKNKITTIWADGGTNVHAGWLSGSMEVAKKLSTKSINRVLVLTDGEISYGYPGSQEVIGAVEGLAQKGISTSTFGVGDHYNEDLLEKMATVSGGNSYYIEDESKVVSILQEEFTCLNNVVANNATLEFIPNNEASVTCLNELDYVNKKFIIGNIVGGKEVTVLLEFKYDNKNPLGQLFNLGKINLEYINDQGKTEIQTIELNYHTVSEEAFNSEKVEEEINIQSTILDIAKQQKLAKEEMKKGNRTGAYDMLKGVVLSASAYSGNARVASEIGEINTLMDVGDKYSDLTMSKMLNSMSYNTRNSKK
jgi:Ca-activated chloride channel family protein